MVTPEEFYGPYIQEVALVEKARERYDLIAAILERANDKELLSWLALLVNKCLRYIKTVRVYVHKREKVQRTFGDSPNALKEYIRDEDANRSSAHEDVIATLQNFNRKLFTKYGGLPTGKIPQGGIFNLNPKYLEDVRKYRGEISDWTFYLILGLGQAEGL